ncbi:MAG: NRDE family protein [Candidatus Bathyarchaeota archaeon]|nr:NRDE family protein [Candidatus Bathyarchaeota archaeon]
MCTLIVLYGFLEDYPVIVLHNRYLNRGTLEEPPRVYEGRRRVYAPYDVASKGTWIGFNDSGLLVAVTNQETEVKERPARSRGLLAMDLLDGCDSAEEAKGFLTDPDVCEDYRRGNFLVADAESAWHVVWDRETEVRRLEPGGHVVTTLTMFPGVEWTDRAENVWVNAEKRRIRAIQLIDKMQLGNLDGLIASLKAMGADHGVEKGPGSICYHYPTGEHIQTSSTIIAVGSDVSESRIHYCPGNPCENEYRDYTSIICN